MVAAITAVVMIVGFIQVPQRLFGVDRYTVTVQLPQAAGLYASGNVTYRGTEVGRVDEVRLTPTGVEAALSLKSDVAIPSDLTAEVHSQTAIGEQYIALLPRNPAAAPLKNGDVIPVTNTSVPADISGLLDATNRGLQAIPREDLKTAVDESYTAVGGLEPEISRIIRGSSDLVIDTGNNLDALTALVDHSGPILDSQADTAGSIRAWAAHLARITEQLSTHDQAVAGVLHNVGPGAEQARQLIERLRPTLPVLLANLVTIGDVALVYQADIEQLLVLAPRAVNLNWPPPCTTGFLPPQQQRSPNYEDSPDRPAGDLYCRVPQDSPFVVRGARNIPCETVPGKRAPTVKMCESDEQYTPLNDGMNWKGDPNATLSGQDIPQQPPEQPPAAPPPGPPPPSAPPPPIAGAEYDPATGQYIGPGGRVYTQADLAQSAPQEKTWQSMLTPPTPQ
jgi:phospholipid/cholesterol/gamma-HCH transport system substrate-binding protein